jgi:hypothetical protein
VYQNGYEKICALDISIKIVRNIGCGHGKWRDVVQDGAQKRTLF